MAMYYYARRLQKSAKKSKNAGQKEMLMTNSNGSIPSVSLSQVVVGAVSGSGSGAPSACAASPSGLIQETRLSANPLNPLNSLNSMSSPGAMTMTMTNSSVGIGVGLITRNSAKSASVSGVCAESSSSNSNSIGTPIPTPSSGQIQPTFSNLKSQVPRLSPDNTKTNLSLNFCLKGPSHLTRAVNHDFSSDLVFEEGHLESGTLDGLVAHLVPSENHHPDRAYIFAFILSSRLFIRPHQLLANLLHRAFFNLKSGEAEVKVVVKLVQLLRDWTQMFPYDFRDDNGLMMANVRAITHKCVHIHPPVKVDVGLLLSTLLDRLTMLEKFESKMQKINVELGMASGHEMIEGGRLLMICPDARLVAEQLTVVELERISFIGAQEFLQAFLKESSPPSTSTTDSGASCTPGGFGGSKSLKRSRLESYVLWFHRLSLCVATDVCKTGRKKERVRCLEFWVQVATECLNVANFNSTMAILTAINSIPVRRLTKTWSKLSCTEALASVERAMDPFHNFENYRSRLKVLQSGTNCKQLKVVIPFFSLLIKDLFFLKEECASRLPNGHIQFDKMLNVGRTVGEVVSWQQQISTFEEVPQILHMVQTLPALTEPALLLASYECEPPGNDEEEAQLQSLLNVNTVDTVDGEEELTDSFQSLPLPSTSSGSTSGCHEEEPEMSPIDIHKYLGGDSFDLNLNTKLTPNTHKAKQKPPVPL